LLYVIDDIAKIVEYVILGIMALEKSKTLAHAFGNHVREIRQSKGMSMQKLADEMNVEFRQIARIEGGEVNTTLQMAFALAKAFGMSLSELFEFDPYKTE
jgi:ribosome-binding protein aMBF1 (putative translation factor)